MADKNNFPNGLNQGEGKDSFKEFMEKLNKEGRVELGNFSAELLAKYGTLNLAVWKKGDLIKIRSGGFEIVLKDNAVEVYREKKVQVNGKIIYIMEKEPMHVYMSRCLSRNIEALLSKLLAEYGYEVNDNWISVKLPRSNVEVRKLQSWLLATINGFNKPLHDSPLVC
jgi:hypothetical protein